MKDPITKAAAWDLVGGDFWRIGRKTARPSDNEIKIFLDSIPAGKKCAIIGASTKNLVEAAIRCGLVTQVFDFSAVMCADLAACLRRDSLTAEITVLDITKPLPIELIATQDVVVSDRLLNRFSHEEATSSAANMIKLLAPRGQIRLSVKLGLYQMDLSMLTYAKKLGLPTDFFDEHSQIMDFSAAGTVLDNAVLPHGDIPRDTLLAWYRGRGREKRFSRSEVLQLFAAHHHDGLAITTRIDRDFPDAPGTAFMVFERLGASVSCAE